MEKQRKTFLSYSRVNKDFAIRLAKELKSEGFNVWLDQLDIPAGARWDREVERALKESEIFMIILTPASVESENVLDEIGYAIDNSKRFLPVLLEKCDVPFRLRRFQYVDFTNKGFDDGVESAKELLKGLVEQPTIPRMEVPSAAQLEAERKAREETERLAAQKVEEERVAKAKADAERKAKTEAKRQAKQDAERLAAQKAEEERLVAQQAEEARIAKEEADRLAAQKADEQRLAKAKADADRLAAQKAEEDRLARIEAERKAKEESDRLAAQKADEQRLAKAKADADRLAAQKAEEDRLARIESERKAKEDREAKVEADRLAEQERFAKQKAEQELAAQRQAETQRKAKEEAQRLAAQKGEEERIGKESVAAAVPVSVAPVQKKRAPNGLVIAVIAAIGVVVCAVAGFGIRAMLNGGSPPATTPTQSASNPATEAPVALKPNNSPNTNASNLDALAAAAQQEGSLTVIGLPHDWCNYGEVISAFHAKYPGIAIKELSPDVGSSEQIDAIKNSSASDAPDVIDVGVAFGDSAKADNLIQPYKVSTWNSIPAQLKDPGGYWYGDYYGVISFLVNTDVQPNVPQDWSDLLKPEYKGQVALSGDPHTSNQAIQSIYASALANGGSLDNAQPGLEFFARLNTLGNLNPVISNDGLVAKGQTPIRITWDYITLFSKNSFAGNPKASVVIPRTGRLGISFVQAISAHASHPNAAKLWMEFLYSDEGQLLWMKGYCHPIREADMRARGVIPSDLLAKFPDTNGVVFPTQDKLAAAREFITAKWDSVVGVNIQSAP